MIEQSSRKRTSHNKTTVMRDHLLGIRMRAVDLLHRLPESEPEVRVILMHIDRALERWGKDGE